MRMLLGWSVIEVQSGWTTVTLGELGVWGSGGTPSKSNPRYYGGDVSWAVIGDLNDQTLSSTTAFITREGLNNSSAKLVQPNTLLIAMYGSIGKLAVTAIECATNQAIAFCVPYEQATSTKYLYWALRHARPELMERGQGAGQQNISQTILKSFEIKLAPLSEQTRIVHALDGLLAQVDTLKARLDALPALIKRFRQSVLSVAYSGELTSIWRKEAKPYLNCLHEDFPESTAPYWEKKTVLAIAKNEKYSIGIGPFGSNLKVSDYKDRGHPLVFVREIRAGRFDDERTRYISNEKFVELAAHRAKPGDILVTKMGDPPGDTSIYPEHLPEAVITSDCIKLRIDAKQASRDFIYYQMKSEAFRAKVLEISAGVAQQKVSLANFKELELAIPPLEEQTEIVQRIRQLLAFADQLEARLADARQRVDALTQSILAKAFRGELVPQDPNDEPASVLLERIAAQRAADPKPKRGRKTAAH